MRLKRAISKKQVQLYLDELVVLAKSIAPNVEAISHIPGDEEQHAWLKIYVPDELEEKIDEVISERAYNIFIETGYDIATIVYEKSQLQHVVAEA